MADLPTTAPHGARVAPPEYLSFTLGEEEYGIDIQRVQELRGYDAVTHLANSASYIKGVVNLRGVIVPIIDMRIKFNLETVNYDQFTVVIILNIDHHIIGIVVDSVSDVITLTPDQIKPAPQLGQHMNADFLLGIGAVEQRMLMLVDITKLMSSSEMGVIEQAHA